MSYNSTESVSPDLPPQPPQPPQPPYSQPDLAKPYSQIQTNAPPCVVTLQPQLDANPGADAWMVAPTVAVPNCPPGLKCLTQLDQLMVRQKVELLEAMTGFETNNKYTIKNTMGQKVFWAAKNNDCCTRNCCSSARPFEMNIFDASGREVIRLSRPLACQSCCFPCCLQSMEVFSPPGNLIGTIEQQWTLCAPSFVLKNQSGESVLRIEGPFCTTSFCCGDVDFELITMDGTQVGKISKQFSGWTKEFFTDADYLGINFPMDLNVKMKAILLGACFLIDFMFYEY